MRPELPDILRSYARDLSIAGPQYATMSAVLREAADALSPKGNPACSIRPPDPVYDGDSVPGYGRCVACEE